MRDIQLYNKKRKNKLWKLREKKEKNKRNKKWLF